MDGQWHITELRGLREPAFAFTQVFGVLKPKTIAT